MSRVINDLVGYDNMKIVQDNDYFNFSLESVILPNFCKINSKMKNIIDFCTGNAPIPLILSTLTGANIVGVELQKEVFELAKATVKINNLKERIKLLNIDVKDIINYFPTDSFDLITCNPPYFKVDEGSNFNENMVKSIARHEICISLEDVILTARKLLKNNSSLVLVHRTDRLAEIFYLLKKYNLEPKRMRLIYPKEGVNSNLVLIDATKNGKVGLKVMTPLICHNDDGSYTKEILEMFEG